MSQYSEVLGSFTRVGDFPLEANYIFNSEKQLKDFYSDELNKTVLHQGLLKVVAESDKQSLYWAVLTNKDLDNPEYEFQPLITSNSIKALNAAIEELKKDDNRLAVIDKGYYDTSKEAIVISFAGDDTEYYIPAADLITEWNIENAPESAIKLEKVRVEGDGPDLLRADVILDSSIDNILEKKGNKLLVNGKLLLKYIKFGEDRKTLQLDNYDTISGKDTNGAGHNLAMVSKWNKADFGSPGLPINLNGNEERPTYNDTKEIALLNDLTKFITEDDANKQYLAKSELDWYEG